jgi:hypothetical protein
MRFAIAIGPVRENHIAIPRRAEARRHGAPAGVGQTMRRRTGRRNDHRI